MATAASTSSSPALSTASTAASWVARTDEQPILAQPNKAVRGARLGNWVPGAAISPQTRPLSGYSPSSLRIIKTIVNRAVSFTAIARVIAR